MKRANGRHNRIEFNKATMNWFVRGWISRIEITVCPWQNGIWYKKRTDRRNKNMNASARRDTSMLLVDLNPILIVSMFHNFVFHVFLRISYGRACLSDRSCVRYCRLNCNITIGIVQFWSISIWNSLNTQTLARNF